MNASDYIDLDRYPIHQTQSNVYKTLLSSIHQQLDSDGCAVLKGFIRENKIVDLVEEADRVALLGHRSFNRTNAYFTQDKSILREGHPLRRFYDRSNAFVPADNFKDDSPLRTIYEWDAFAPFIQQAMREQNFYRYADPLADVIINVVEEGNGFPWHFDTNNYTVTLAIQNGERGGDFQYCPHIRTSDDECYDIVEAVLDGDKAPVKTLVLEPGDLQFFKGRYSLHRVNPVGGTRKRYVGIFSYVETEGMCGSVERTKQLYGRVLPIHIKNANLRTDTLVD